MKTFYPSGKAIICLMLILNSCASSKNSVEQPKTAAESTKDQAACFVQMNDGSIKNYTSLKLVTGVFKTPHLVADDKIVITTADIKAYQSKDHYAIAQKGFTAGKPGSVAVEALPGFAVRVARGKINVYAVKFYNGHNTTEKFYLQSGDEGQIAAYTPELMKTLIRDNSEAFNYFSGKKAAPLPKKLLATIDIYNNSWYISMN